MNKEININLRDIPSPIGISGFTSKYDGKWRDDKVYVVIPRDHYNITRLQDHVLRVGYCWMRGKPRKLLGSTGKVVGLYDTGIITGPIERIEVVSLNSTALLFCNIEGYEGTTTIKQQDVCPKCGSQMVWQSLALKCNNCWYTC